MISTKDLSGLPNAERLKNFCKGLAALDIIMVEEEWSFIRHYTYDPAWRKGKEAFFATDGSDQSMIVMFTYGIGMLLGSQISGALYNRLVAGQTVPQAWVTFWWIPAVAAAAIALIFLLTFKYDDDKA